MQSNNNANYQSWLKNAYTQEMLAGNNGSHVSDPQAVMNAGVQNQANDNSGMFSVGAHDSCKSLWDGSAAGGYAYQMCYQHQTGNTGEGWNSFYGLGNSVNAFNAGYGDYQGN